MSGYEKTYRNKKEALHVYETGNGSFKFHFEYQYPFYINTHTLLQVVNDYLKWKLENGDTS